MALGPRIAACTWLLPPLGPMLPQGFSCGKPTMWRAPGRRMARQPLLGPARRALMQNTEQPQQKNHRDRNADQPKQEAAHRFPLRGRLGLSNVRYDRPVARARAQRRSRQRRLGLSRTETATTADAGKIWAVPQGGGSKMTRCMPGIAPQYLRAGASVVHMNDHFIFGVEATLVHAALA